MHRARLARLAGWCDEVGLLEREWSVLETLAKDLQDEEAILADSNTFGQMVLASSDKIVNRLIAFLGPASTAVASWHAAKLIVSQPPGPNGSDTVRRVFHTMVGCSS